jgi:thymidylate synthase
MRSSDAWLGLPYDIFNFSMITAKVACMYNKLQADKIRLGDLYLTMASSHLYEQNIEAVNACLAGDTANFIKTYFDLNPVPENEILSGNWEFFMHSLVSCRDKVPSEFLWRIRP